MKKRIFPAVVLLSALALLPATSFALNPIIQTMYTADPAPIVHNGTLYLFSGHDEDVGEANNFNMKNWVVSTTTDMVNWTQHGAIASLRDLPWAAKEISGWLPDRSPEAVAGESSVVAQECWKVLAFNLVARRRGTARDVPHHARVAVELHEQVGVVGSELPEHQPLGLQEYGHAGILAPHARCVSYLDISSLRRNVPAMESLRPYSMEP